MSRQEDLAESQQSLTEHLRELRTRIIKALYGILIGAIICYNYVEQIMLYIRAPIERHLQGGGLVFTAPADKFIAYLKVAVFCGFIVATPWWLYQAWKFVAPGLYAKEKKYSLAFIFSGSVLYIAGVVFGYFLALPAAFDFLMMFGDGTDKPMITIDHYLSFFTTMLLVFGLAFELPLIIVILGMLGFVSQDFLRKNRRYMVVILAIASAILTPTPDAISMFTLLIPLYILFEISIFFVGFFEKKAEEPADERPRT
ncbi:MAG: twin-arginine translocase subunit TatC [Bdellovibrionaceae bacterium]|nr:twin-arginine translocase subunit TatC [Pseudobdellovibrionaceae bacterium]